MPETLIPGATIRLIDSEFLSDKEIVSHDRVTIHVTASEADSQFGYFNATGRASSNCHIARDGEVEQYVPGNLAAEADYEGNTTSFSIELQGGGPNVNTETIPEAQLASLVRVIVWRHQQYGTPLRLATTSLPNDESSKGIAWHRLGVDGNFPELPSILAGRKQRGGGMRYSTVTGKICPGDARILQMPDILARCLAAVGQPAASTPTAPPQGAPTMAWVAPVRNIVTSHYNPFRKHPITGKVQPHTGTDMRAATGTPVVAASAGEVTRAFYDKGAGNNVRVLHADGITTRYYHLSKISVRAGQKVSAGQQIGLAGSTGSSTAPHLHFEVRTGGQPGNPTNPVPFMAARGVTLGSTKGPVAPSGGTNGGAGWDNGPYSEAQIREAQELLNDFGGYNLATDGKRGPATIAATKDAQGKLGATVDGWPGDATKASLRASIAARNAATVTPGVPAPPFPLPSGYYFGPKSGPKESVSGYYSHREDLRRYHQRMADRGWKITVDGLYGDETERITKLFQAEKGLAGGADGLIGPVTWAAAWTEPITK